MRERSDVVLGKLRLAEPERAEGALAARGLLDASALLARRFVLLATNVPFLGRGKQESALAAHILRRMPEAKADLATAMLQRMRTMVMSSGTVAVVTPQSWLFLAGYQTLRLNLLTSASLSLVAGLGPRAFETITGEVVNIGLIVLRNAPSVEETVFTGIDANAGDDPKAKTEILQSDVPRILNQQKQRLDTASRISLRDVNYEGDLIRQYASVLVGLTTGDAPKFIRKFWEWRRKDQKWEFFQTTVAKTQDFGGMTDSLLWENEAGELSRFAASVKHLNHIAQNWRRGKPSWGHRGISVSMMGDLEASIYTGERYDSNCCAIVPNSERHLSAFWAYCNSPRFRSDIRGANANMKIEVGTILSSRIDIAYWKEVANEQCPSGLPEPYCDDPTQWLFHGHPAHAALGTELHVALARVAGYRWPAETDATLRLSDIAKERIVGASTLPSGDPDGLLPLHANGNHLGLADRLRQVLAAAYGAPLSPVRELTLIRAADAKLDKKDARGATLESWLADRAFRQHCVLFHQRPFLWQVWDGMKEGFSAFLHCHRMDRLALDKLTYTLLGDWIRRAKDERNTARLERAERLQQMLAKIIEGERPFDIFVRWKSLEQQPIGWEPDIDDGVRLNIRPFMTAGILREQPKGISWNKDRGADTSSAPWYDLGLECGGKQGDRINDHHLTLAEKRAARNIL